MGTENRRIREKEQRKQTILEAAERIFAMKGFDETIMTDIAQEVELSKGTLYLYFKSKEELAFAIFLRNLTKLKQMIKDASASETLGIEKIRKLLQAYLSFYKEHFYLKAQEGNSSRFYLNRIFEYYFQSEHSQNAYAQKCYRVIDEILETIVEAASKGISDGTVRKEIDPAKTAVTYGNLVLLFMLRLSQGHELVLKGRGYLPEDLLNHMFGLFLNSLENT